MQKENQREQLDAMRGYFHQMAYYMRQWAVVCKKLI
jgi:hypothetical protein